MDRFTVMSSFVHVVREGSFSAAAQSLGYSRALVSRHIADLENRLGVRLLNRTTRSVNLTEAGRQHYDFCQRVLTDIEHEESSIVNLQREPEGTLKVVAPKWIGLLDFGDAILQFAKQNPKIAVSLNLGPGLSARAYDFIDKGYDVALQTKHIRDSAVIVRKIATLKMLAVAAPQYLERHAAPKNPADLAHHRCLLHANDAVWRFSTRRNGSQSVKIEGTFTSNTHLVLRAAALKGLGIAILPLRGIEEQLASGALSVVLEDFPIPDRPLYVVHAPGGKTPQKVRQFVNFMVAWFHDHPLPTQLRN